MTLIKNRNQFILNYLLHISLWRHERPCKLILIRNLRIHPLARNFRHTLNNGTQLQLHAHAVKTYNVFQPIKS